MYKVDLPLVVQVSKKKKFIINLNHYRNTHCLVLNKAKVEYSNIVKHKIFGIPLLKKVKIDYYLYPKDKRMCDVSNVCCIQDKFFCDVLSTYNVIDDDNYNNVAEIHYYFGSVDPDNPRVTAIITPIED